MLEIFKVIDTSIVFLANLATAILGCYTIITLVMNRKKISRFLSIVINNHLNEKIKRIKETLGKIDSLSYHDKESREEIVALLGQLSGQIKNLTSHSDGMHNVHEEITGLISKRTGLNEAVKRRIMYELHGELDNLGVESSKEII